MDYVQVSTGTSPTMKEGSLEALTHGPFKYVSQKIHQISLLNMFMINHCIFFANFKLKLSKPMTLRCLVNVCSAWPFNQPS